MDFTVQGSPSPRTYQRNLAGNGAASRPTSGKPQSRRNPITGEEVQYEPPPSARISNTQRPNSRPTGVPGLDLKYLHDGDKRAIKPLEIYDYSLDTPGTASTVSFRTGRSQLPGSSRPTSAQRKSTRPADIPELYLAEDGAHIPPPKQKAKQPTAWDKAPVPEGLIAKPSSKHKQLYQQYQDDMKESYKHYTSVQKGQPEVSEEEVNRAVQAVKKMYSDVAPSYYENEDSPESESDENDLLQLSYTNKTFSSLTDAKKLDANEFEEYKRKQHLIETVMIDQLSRAVISDPEQDRRTVPRSHRPGMARGTNRSLHESKVSTNSTATENLLQRRVRFGARLLTRNGHDALRELTGFFFHVDNSLTVYEFKQFGKSSKALPFVPRGQYKHIRGRRAGDDYTLTDIYPGANLEFHTKGKQTLPDSVKKEKIAVFRVTDVDDEEKSKIILAGVSRSEKEKAYARLHMPKSKEELEERVLLLEIQSYVRKLLKKRGVRTVMGLGHHCRKLDKDGSSLIPRFDLEKALLQYHIDLSEGVLSPLLSLLDEEGSGYIDYSQFLRAVIGEMNEYRKRFVRKEISAREFTFVLSNCTQAFQKIDAGKRGCVSFSDIRKFYNAAKHPKVLSGHCSETSIVKSYLEAFQYCGPTEEVSYCVFEEYYEGLSMGVDKDQDLVTILTNSWSL